MCQLRLSKVSLPGILVCDLFLSIMLTSLFVVPVLRMARKGKQIAAAASERTCHEGPEPATSRLS